jgi:dienelactone hydrolase
VTLLSAAPTPFSFAATAHPAILDPADALAATIPTALLASKDENPAAVRQFAENLRLGEKEKLVETYADQVHGWMGARGDLADPRCREEYERGYRTVVEFFQRFV